MDILAAVPQMTLLAVIMALMMTLIAVAAYALGQRRAVALLTVAQSRTVVMGGDMIPIIEEAPAPSSSGPAAEAYAAEAPPPAADAGGLAAGGDDASPIAPVANDLAPVRFVAGRGIRANGSVIHQRQLNDAEAVNRFVQWIRDEADRPADSNDPEAVWERVCLVSWMRPQDLYFWYRTWCREHAVVPDSRQNFMTAVQTVRGVHYGRHRLNGPAFEHIRHQIGKDRALVVRVESNHEREAAVRDRRARAGSGLASTSRRGAAVGAKRSPIQDFDLFEMAQSCPPPAQRMARAA